jgi:hypothetical protein
MGELEDGYTLEADSVIKYQPPSSRQPQQHPKSEESDNV